MRFTELERSILAVNAALTERLDLIEQGDDLADTIAKDTTTVADLRREANRREAELIDEREDLRKELQRVRDDAYARESELIQDYVEEKNELERVKAILGEVRKQLQRIRDQRDRLYIFASLQPGVRTDSSGILREIAAELDERTAVPE